MALSPRVTGGIAGRLPGRTRQGSQAYLRRNATESARRDMAQILSKYSAFIKRMKGLTPGVLRDALEPVYDKSQYYVPVKSGALANSGQLSVEQVAGRWEGSITYGGKGVWYAALVHEYVWFQHHAPTRSKYLQAALEEELDNFMITIATGYGKLFRRY